MPLENLGNFSCKINRAFYCIFDHFASNITESVSLKMFLFLASGFGQSREHNVSV